MSVREAYVLEAPEFESLEATMKKFEEDGKWKMLSKTQIEDYIHGLPGLAYVFQILPL